jgi:hypothetical protein
MRLRNAICIFASENSSHHMRRVIFLFSFLPITMITFLFLVVMDSFGLLSFRLSGDVWLLLQIGLGGYVVGRSGEKIVERMK